MLLAMRYKSFVWPNNPRTYTLHCKRQTATLLAPGHGFVVQELGRGSAVLQGEGEFFGPGAYEQFKALLAVFEQDGAGLLIHPAWQCGRALFTGLRLMQEPREDYVVYSFEFCEQTPGSLADEATITAGGRTAGGTGKIYHPMGAGETLWSVAARYMLSMAELLRMNPQIDNPNHTQTGQKVRVR